MIIQPPTQRLPKPTQIDKPNSQPQSTQTEPPLFTLEQSFMDIPLDLPP